MTGNSRNDIFASDAVRMLSESNHCRVVGTSMVPTLLPGDVLEFKHVWTEEICVGDVLLYQSKETLVVHRVVALKHAGIATKGDNNYEEDKYLLDSGNVLGLVVAVWRNGRRKTIHRGQFGRLFVLGLKGRRALLQQGIPLIVPLYRRLKLLGPLSFGILYKKYRLIRFGTGEMRLLLGAREVGTYYPKIGWKIRPPYDLLINKDRLPVE